MFYWKLAVSAGNQKNCCPVLTIAVEYKCMYVHNVYVYIYSILFYKTITQIFYSTNTWCIVK